MLSIVKLDVNSKTKDLNKEQKDKKDIQAKLASNEEKIVELQTYLDKMKKMIAENQLENDRLKKENDQVMNERDYLGAHLIRRNDELALLNEKIRIMENTLKKGEQQFAEKCYDIYILKFVIQDLKAKKRISDEKNQSIRPLKEQVHHLQKKLLEEQVKVKALSEELENPQNVHRWRRLEGTDPET